MSFDGVLILKFKSKIENINIVNKFNHSKLIDMHILTESGEIDQ